MESEDEKTLSCHANCLNENRYIQEILAINTRINIVKDEKIASMFVILTLTQSKTNGECGRILGVLSSSWAIAKDPGNMKPKDSSSQAPQNDSLYDN